MKFLVSTERKVWNYYSVEAATPEEAKAKYYTEAGEHLGYIDGDTEDLETRVDGPYPDTQIMVSLHNLEHIDR